MLNKFLFLLLTGLMCLVFVGAASAVTNSQSAYTAGVTTANSAVDGHKVVYEKEFSDTDYDIYVTDLTTGTPTSVSTSSNDERNPDISGNIVVWQSQATGGKWQIYWKDISTSNAAEGVHASTNDQKNPSVSGNYVVWQEYCSGSDAETHNQYDDYDIKGYNLATKTYFASIASSNQYEGSPDISGNTMVYQKYENIGTSTSPKWIMQIYKTTFGTTNQGTKIDPYDSDQRTPRISGNKVLWSGFNVDTNSYDIWCENLATGTGFWVTKTTDFEYNSDISGNIAVWDKMTETDMDVLMQDISSSSNPKINIAKGTSYQSYPAVGIDQYGIFVSFTDNKDGTYRVYWRNMDSTSPKPTAGSPARNAVNVPVDKVITTTFSEPIKLGAGLIKLVSSSGALISITKSINGKVLTITPTTALKKATKYTLILAAGSVTDYAGNPIAAYSRPFTTDSTPPKAIAGKPARNTVNVPLDAVITTTFNEPIYAANMWVTLKTASGTSVTINPFINGNILCIFHLQLKPSTKYIIELHTGCIKDAAGNLLKYYYRYFTTAAT